MPSTVLLWRGENAGELGGDDVAISFAEPGAISECEP
jgi:hypothetical protein